MAWTVIWYSIPQPRIVLEIHVRQCCMLHRLPSIRRNSLKNAQVLTTEICKGEDCDQATWEHNVKHTVPLRTGWLVYFYCTCAQWSQKCLCFFCFCVFKQWCRRLEWPTCMCCACRRWRGTTAFILRSLKGSTTSLFPNRVDPLYRHIWYILHTTKHHTVSLLFCDCQWIPFSDTSFNSL